MYKLPLPSLAIALSLVIAAALPAQTVGGSWSTLHTDFGESYNCRFGEMAASLGDVDGDGISDYVVGSGGTNGYKGSAFIYSGATHLEIRRIDSALASGQFGRTLSEVGDLDGDGLAEVLISAAQANHLGLSHPGWVGIFRGSDGSVLYEYDGDANYQYRGHAVAGADDLNDDGVPEFLFTDLAHLQASHTGAVHVMDGATGTTIRIIAGVTQGSGFGNGMSMVGDLDGDGLRDIVVTSLYSTEVTAFSVATGAEIWSQTMDGVDASLSPIGDLDADGVNDVLVGGPSASPNGIGWAGSVYLVSGVDGSLIRQMDGSEQWEFFGMHVTRSRDMNGDLLEEIVLGRLGASASFQSGSVMILSGADSSLIQEFPGLNQYDSMGYCGNLGDIEGDGREALIFGAPSAESGGIALGWIEIVNFEPFVFNDSIGFSASSGGTSNYELNFPSDAAGDTYQTLLSAKGRGPSTFANGVKVPLSLDIWLAQTYLGMYPPVFNNPVGVLDAQGDGLVQLTVPPRAANNLVGEIFYLAVACKPSAELWRYCSIAVAVEVLP